MSEYQHISTADGSSSIYLAGMDETYHSRHGALRESQHVFIENGLLKCDTNASAVRVFELGFGTGLNALLTWITAIKSGFKVEYYTVEKYPISMELASKLNYGMITGEAEKFTSLHEAEWERRAELDNHFTLNKVRVDLDEMRIETQFDVVYYDAFAPRVQPNMWTVEKLERACSVLRPGGLFVSYCAQGQFRRNLKSLGFSVEALPGPPGKREMTSAIKLK